MANRLPLPIRRWSTGPDGRVWHPGEVIAGRLLRTRARRWTALAAIVLVVAAVVVAVWPSSAEPSVPAEGFTIAAPGGPGVAGTVTLDAGLYVPAHTPAPAVILAHGFGGSRLSVDQDAQRLARDGFVVLAYSARGFGASTGQIALDSLDHEVADARAVVDWLAHRPEVLADGPEDPRVGVMGTSYGGALALMLAGTDPRIDAVAAIATWNDLTQALFPDNGQVTDPGTGVAHGGTPTSIPATAPAQTPAAIPPGDDGVFKRSWAAALMNSVISGSGLPAAVTDSDSVGSDVRVTPDSATGVPACGRLMPDLCAAYTQVAQTGRLTPAMASLLARSSPAAVAGRITAPTLLAQGESDTLFGLDQADATARQIAGSGTPVAVSWYPGGHNGGGLNTATENRVTAWLKHYLAGTGSQPSEAFQYTVAGPLSDNGRARSRTLQVAGYPGISGQPPAPQQTIPLSGPAQTVINPPGGLPAAISSLPGISGTGTGVLGALSALPGQTAVFTSDPVASTTVVTGSATVNLQVSRPAASPAVGGSEGAGSNESAVLYVSLAAVDESSGSGPTLAALLSAGPAGGAVAPVRIDGLVPGGDPVTVRVHLPAVAFQLQPGQAFEVRVATTDQGYAGPIAPAVYRIALAGDSALSIPIAGGQRVSASEEPVGLVIGLVALVLVGVIALVFAGRAPRHRRVPLPPRDADARTETPALPATTPLEITGLRKQYPGGVVAVDDVSFRVERGQVHGLLGPNGAGKTTTLRMVMGLIAPSAGEILLFGTPVGPGAEILSRVGSFVEGSGFLPHLSGRTNLELYWRATGRPAGDAHLAEALAIADLGRAIERRVKTYSQGMRQRLAIAQAMLGLPDLLLLDEPTNGLDPPQIHAMREVLRRYAATGRTVLISSHLLSEVEQTCSHVVIIDRGRTIAAGSVAEMVSASGEVAISTADPDAASRALHTLVGIGEIAVTTSGLNVDLAGVALDRALRVLLDAGVPVTAAAPRNRLEDVFLDLVGAAAPATRPPDPRSTP